MRRFYAPSGALTSTSFAILASLLLAGPARAQGQTPLRSIAVPAEAGIVIPPRGQERPRLVAPPSAAASVAPGGASGALAGGALAGGAVAEAAAPVILAPAAGMGLAAPLGIGLPLVAAALLGTGAVGGGSGGSSGASTTSSSGGAPARTSR
ncbi:hypothetical protein BKE38_25815 [Pseudoroseomonas deserti]|uniref:Uncharacterized protein n=2 Tax=Teichococcus deserti TaxID=1817963 RepID=A0A1V2GV20_9PROT|nr:hypothetical protein BKE38_25815 [Pseudoroseomonas deserti]